MNDTKRIEIENRERWLIDQNSIKAHEREQGRLEGRIEMAIEAIKEGLKIELISKLTKLDIDTIQKLKDQL